MQTADLLASVQPFIDEMMEEGFPSREAGVRIGRMRGVDFEAGKLARPHAGRRGASLAILKAACDFALEQGIEIAAQNWTAIGALKAIATRPDRKQYDVYHLDGVVEEMTADDLATPLGRALRYLSFGFLAMHPTYERGAEWRDFEVEGVVESACRELCADLPHPALGGRRFIELLSIRLAEPGENAPPVSLAS